MSSNIMKNAAVKKSKRGQDPGLILDISIKEIDAKDRLNCNCCVFIKLNNDIRFLIISDNLPETVSSDKFFSVAIGASKSELIESKDILSELGSAISYDVYSSHDFYSKVALYFMSKYHKRAMEEFWSPRALAVEYIIFDPMFSLIHTLRFDGNYDSYDIGETDKMFAMAGAYNNRLRKELSKELQACLDKEDISNKTLKNISVKLCGKYHLRMSVVLSPQARAPFPGADAQENAPGPGQQQPPPEPPIHD